MNNTTSSARTRLVRSLLLTGAVVLSIGAISAPSASAKPDLCVSVNGRTVVEHGTAGCFTTEGTGNVAIARGDGSYAETYGGDHNRAFAHGTDSTATVDYGSGNQVKVRGNNSTGEVSNADDSTVMVVGDDNLAGIYDGSDGSSMTVTGDDNYGYLQFAPDSDGTVDGDGNTVEVYRTPTDDQPVEVNVTGDDNALDILYTGGSVTVNGNGNDVQTDVDGTIDLVVEGDDQDIVVPLP